MPQSSLMTWLNKPKAVSEPSQPQQQSIPKEAPVQQTPTPPQDDQDKPETKVDKTFSLKSSLKPLPPNVELRACTKDDIPQFKRLISLLLPIPYSNKFFSEIIEDPVLHDLTLLAMWHDDVSEKGKQKGRLVGALKCKLLAPSPQATKDTPPILYLCTLALLSPYRSHGIATHLLHALTKRGVDNYGINKLGAHVWEANTEALEWYRKRGFREVAREESYYRRLDPQGAVIMQRDVSVMDFLG